VLTWKTTPLYHYLRPQIGFLFLARFFLPPLFKKHPFFKMAMGRLLFFFFFFRIGILFYFLDATCYLFAIGCDVPSPPPGMFSHDFQHILQISIVQMNQFFINFPIGEREDSLCDPPLVYYRIVFFLWANLFCLGNPLACFTFLDRNSPFSLFPPFVDNHCSWV